MADTNPIAKFPPTPEVWASLPSDQRNELVAMQTEPFFTCTHTFSILKLHLYSNWPTFPLSNRHNRVKWMQFACFCFFAFAIAMAVWCVFAILNMNKPVTLHLVLTAIWQQLVFFVMLYFMLNFNIHVPTRDFRNVLAVFHIGVSMISVMCICGADFPAGALVTIFLTLVVSCVIDAFRLAKAAIWFGRLNRILDGAEVITSPVFTQEEV